MVEAKDNVLLFGEPLAIKKEAIFGEMAVGPTPAQPEYGLVKGLGSQLPHLVALHAPQRQPQHHRKQGLHGTHIGLFMVELGWRFHPFLMEVDNLGKGSEMEIHCGSIRT
jgi:hypothetical protein